MGKIFEWLQKVPFLGTVISFVVKHTRLALEYMLIGMVIACAATAITLWFRTNTLEDRNTELIERVANIEIVTNTQDKTITLLQDLRKVDAGVMAGLVDDFAKLAKSDSNVRKKLSDLEKQNENVKRYLDQPVPAELACMLNSSCTDENGGRGDKNTTPERFVGTVYGTGR